MSEKTSKAGGRKKNVFKHVVELAKQYPIIGIVNMANLPTAQLQRMREQLRGKIEVFMAKKRVVQKAIEQLKEITNLNKLSPYLEKAQPALIFTKENPFALFKTLKQNKSKAPAKGGQIAPNDIIIPAGPTPFAPGPVIGELGALGIKSGVERGKIAIKNDTTVCKEGDVITEKLASILTRLGIEPMEIGLDLKAVYEKGTIYTKRVLDIDETQFMNNLNLAITEAYNLAIETAYCTKDTTEELVRKAFREAKIVAKQGKIMCDIVAEELVEQAEREMLAVKGELKNVPVKAKTEVKEAPKSEPKAPKEEVKEEAKVEEEPKAKEKPEVKEEPKVEETQEKPKEEVKEEKKTEEPKPKAPKEEPVKEEPKKEEVPKADELQKQADEKKKEEEKPKEKPHPKQGKVSQDQAADLLSQLQKQGTLRRDES